jgi:sugar-specific transcriptional regulator TrmB
LGLIEKFVDTPTKFKAIPAKEAVDMLIERRKKETAQLEEKSIEVIRHFTTAIEQAELKDEESQFIIMNDLQARLIKAKTKIRSVKKSIKIAATWSFFATYTLECVEEYTEALNRGVNVQVVMEKRENIGKLPKKLQALMKHPLFQIRYVSFLPPLVVAIFDKEEVRIPIQPNKTPYGTGVLMSNSPSLIELAENYFEIVWNSYRLSALLLNAIPYPAMLIQSDRIVIAANEIALEMGAKIGEPCWREFGRRMFLRDRKDRCWFCMADEAMCENAEKHRNVEALGRLWDARWIPVEKGIFLYFAIDIAKSKQI